jgi:hypothetical protein
MPKITKPTTRKFFLPDDPYEGYVNIKHLLPGEVSVIHNQCFKQKVNYKAGKGKKDGYKPEIKQESDPDLFRMLPARDSIVSWGGFLDEDDKEMPCNDANKELMINTLDNFVEWIDECREKIADDIAEEKEEQLKNLKGSALKSPKENAGNAEPPTDT